MIVLAFDTATPSCAIAIWRDGEVLSQAREMLDRGHAEMLVPMIENVLRDADLSYQDLDLLAVTNGPGAFTGIRIGLATARALSLASGLPLIGISNFDALAHAIPVAERQGHLVLIVLETKRADFYVCCYDEALSIEVVGQAIDSAGLLKLVAEVKADRSILLVGDCLDRTLETLPPNEYSIALSEVGPYVDPAVVAQMAAARYQSDGEGEKPAPLYLKPPDVNMSGVKPPTRLLKSKT